MSFTSQTALAAGKTSSAQQPFTQEQIEFLKNELAKRNAFDTSFSFYGLVQVVENLSDTQRNNAPDFGGTGQHVRLGTKVSGGMASGQVEVELIGNQPTGASDGIDPVSGTVTSSTAQSNGIALRQAQINIDAVNVESGNNTFLTTVSLGGIRIGGAAFTAPDVANVPTQYARQDGMYLQEKISHDKKLDVTLAFGVFNTLFGQTPGNGTYSGWGGNSVVITQPSLWTGTSPNNHLAYLGSLNASYYIDANRTISGAFFYGTQKNAPSLLDAGANVINTRNASHMEGSVFYNDAKMFGTKGVLSVNGVSFWYEKENNSRSQLASTSTNGMVDDSETASLYGLGIAGDTSPFFGGMIQKGDRLTYAAAYSIVTNDFGNTSAQSYTIGEGTEHIAYSNQNYSLYQIAASVGYAVNTFEVALNAEITHASESIFTNSNGSKPESTEMKTYVTAAYVF